MFCHSDHLKRRYYKPHMQFLIPIIIILLPKLPDVSFLVEHMIKDSIFKEKLSYTNI